MSILKVRKEGGRELGEREERSKFKNEDERGNEGCHATTTLEFYQEGETSSSRSVPFAFNRSVRVGSEGSEGAVHGSSFPLSPSQSALHLLRSRWLNDLSLSSSQDEIFHIPQTQQYCSGNFKDWDPKLTTPPGLFVFFPLALRSLRSCELTFLPPFVRFLQLFPLPPPPFTLHPLPPPPHQPPSAFLPPFHHQPPPLSASSEVFKHKLNRLGTLRRKHRHLALPSPVVLL